jgi:hypothetical protein
MPMLFVKKEINVPIEFPRVVYPSVQPKWDGKSYDKLDSIRVENAEEYKALTVDFVLNFKEVTNIVKPKRKPPIRKQPKLEV